jgi:hypothetical protein
MHQHPFALANPQGNISPEKQGNINQLSSSGQGAAKQRQSNGQEI